MIDVRLVPARDGLSWRVTVEGRPVCLPTAPASPSAALHALARLLEGLAWSECRPEAAIAADPCARIYSTGDASTGAGS